MADEKNEIRKEVEKALESGAGPKAARFVLACLAGIPYAGGAFGAAAGAWSEQAQKKFNELLTAWLKLQEEEIKEIGLTLAEVMIRLDPNDPQVEQRVRSPAFLSLIKKCFRDWSAAESEGKRILIRNLLVNAASCSLTRDDVLRLFVEWINKYSEAHFKIVACIYKNPGTTRREIWDSIHGEPVQDNSTEADLFKTIIHDLSVGHLIRQHRDIDSLGRFKKQQSSSGSSDPYMVSAFDDKKKYELTQLGQTFVHYTMNEIVPKIEGSYNAEEPTS